MVTPSLREFNNAAMDTGLLGRIAELGGGTYFDLADIDQLASAVEFTPMPTQSRSALICGISRGYLPC